MSNSDIMNILLKHFRNSKWSKIAGLKKYSTLPYSYSLVKNKDYNKLRPLISYCRHPYKNLQNIINCVLLFMLENCSWNHLTLFKTYSLVSRTREIEKALNAIMVKLWHFALTLKMHIQNSHI